MPVRESLRVPMALESARVLPKSTLWRRADWFSTSEVSCKKNDADSQIKTWGEMILLISSSASQHELFSTHLRCTEPVSPLPKNLAFPYYKWVL